MNNDTRADLIKRLETAMQELEHASGFRSAQIWTNELAVASAIAVLLLLKDAE